LDQLILLLFLQLHHHLNLLLQRDYQLNLLHLHPH
jgi:hypothetical protein